MTYAITFLLISAELAYLAVSCRGWGWTLLWPAISFLLMSVAYSRSTPFLLGKRPDGRIELFNRLILLPYFWYARSVWTIRTRLDPLSRRPMKFRPDFGSAVARL